MLIKKTQKKLRNLERIKKKTLVTSGLPHGQEKSGKTKKNDISQEKMGVFEKSQE